MTVKELWRRAGLRALLMTTARRDRPIRGDGATMDPVMAAMLHIIRRMPPPSGPVTDMRAGYEMGVRITGLRRLRRVRADAIEIEGGPAPLRARRYTPARPTRGTLLFFHGGGFALGSLDTHDRLCRLLADRAGLSVVSVDYRLAPEHVFPAAAEDAAAALAWAARTEPGPLAVGGDSAGAQLATVALMARPDIPVRVQFLLYPVVDMMGGYASEGLFGEGFLLTVPVMKALLDAYVPPGPDRTDARLSPLHAGPPRVPAVVAAAWFDPLRDQARAYACALTAAGVPVRFLEERGLIHGYADFAGVVPEAHRAVLRAADALRDMMDGEAAP